MTKVHNGIKSRENKTQTLGCFPSDMFLLQIKYLLSMITANYKRLGGSALLHKLPVYIDTGCPPTPPGKTQSIKQKHLPGNCISRRKEHNRNLQTMSHLPRKPVWLYKSGFPNTYLDDPFCQDSLHRVGSLSQGSQCNI